MKSRKERGNDIGRADYFHLGRNFAELEDSHKKGKRRRETTEVYREDAGKKDIELLRQDFGELFKAVFGLKDAWCSEYVQRGQSSGNCGKKGERMIKKDFSEEFESELRSWRRNAQIDAVKCALKFLAVVLGAAFITTVFVATLWGFLTTQF